MCPQDKSVFRSICDQSLLKLPFDGLAHNPMETPFQRSLCEIPGGCIQPPYKPLFSEGFACAIPMKANFKMGLNPTSSKPLFREVCMHLHGSPFSEGFATASLQVPLKMPRKGLTLRKRELGLHWTNQNASKMLCINHELFPKSVLSRCDGSHR